MNSYIKLGDHKIGQGQPVFVVAEVSCNHMGEYENAVKIVRAAAEAGADAVKLQTYTADTMTIDAPQEHFKVRGVENPNSWQGMTLYKLYEEAYTPWEWQPKLHALAKELGIELFSAPFDPSAVDFLEKEISPICYKVASYELTDDILLKSIALTKKPVILSNGYATLNELEHAIDVLRNHGAGEIVVLYCVTEYANEPTSSNVNLSTMHDIRERFGVTIGLSDNNGGTRLPIMSVLYGAAVIEKHLMLHKGDEIHDERFSIVPDELKDMVKQIREIETLNSTERADFIKKMDPGRLWWGTPLHGPISDLEKTNTHLRRSLFVVEDIKKGEVFTKKNIRSIRPQVGLSPQHYDEVIGKMAVKNIERGTPLTWSCVVI